MLLMGVDRLRGNESVLADVVLVMLLLYLLVSRLVVVECTFGKMKQR